LILKYDQLVPNFAFNSNLHRYTMAALSPQSAAAAAAAAAARDAAGQGLTLVHFSAQTESLMTQNTP